MRKLGLIAFCALAFGALSLSACSSCGQPPAEDSSSSQLGGPPRCPAGQTAQHFGSAAQGNQQYRCVKQ